MSVSFWFKFQPPYMQNGGTDLAYCTGLCGGFNEEIHLKGWLRAGTQKPLAIIILSLCWCYYNTVDRAVFALMNEGEFARPALQGCLSSRYSNLPPGNGEANPTVWCKSCKSAGVLRCVSPPPPMSDVWAGAQKHSQQTLPLPSPHSTSRYSQFSISIYHCPLFRKKNESSWDLRLEFNLKNCEVLRVQLFSKRLFSKEKRKESG